jgi:signal transduction histidine kinase
VTDHKVSTDYAVSVSQLPATLQQRRLVLLVAILLLIGLAIAAPFGHIQLGTYPAAIVAQQAIVFVNDFITSVLLFGHYSIVRSRGLLLLACGYLFTSLIVIPHSLTFPNAFSPNGLLGAGLQSTAWLYFFWHIGIGLGILAYACLKDTSPAESATVSSAASTVAWGVTITIGLVVGITWLATAEERFLPEVFINRVDLLASTLEIMAGLMFLSGAIPFAVLLVRRRSVLDYWLMLVAWTLMLEEILIGFVTTTRYSVGFYAGRAFSLLTSMIIISLLLKEMIALYARLARANIVLARERENKLMSFEAITAAIAHQINQPLAAIAANGETVLEYLQQTPSDLRKIRAIANDIVNDSYNASSAFDGVRALFGRADQQRRPTNMNEIVVDTLQSLRGELTDHGVITRLELAPALPLVDGNGNQLQQVILNLVHNAVEAMNATTNGSRVLQLASKRHGRGAIAVTVQDSGPGIDPRHLGNVFDAFVTTKAHGMGLGLAICRMIAERHGGQLTGSSNGNGAVFELVLPILRAEDAEAAP